MGNTDLAIRIATILDSTGLKKADKGITGLQKSAKSLGKSLGVALSVGAVVAFGKAAAKAFIEDEKAAAMLANTIKNLGLEFATPSIENFIHQLEATSGVLDDKLRPSMQKFLTTTGSVMKSQELLQRAIEISRGSGVDLETVVSDLTAAYVGNTKGLAKYRTGLTKTELAAMSFEEIMAKLNGQFKGANADYMKTYAYKMDLLNVAAANAKETIGKGLIDALMALTNNTDIQGLISDIDAFANGLAQTLVYIGKLLAPIVKGIEVVIGFLKQDSTAAAFGRSQADQIRTDKSLYPKAGNNAITGYKETAEQKANRLAIAKAEKDAAKRAKALADAQKKNTAELKKQAIAKKQNSLFDMEQIQIIAALKGNISKEEELRLKLQLALITGNEDQAKKLSDQLADSIDKTGKLKQYINTLPEAPNPFAAWDTFLDGVIAKARLAASIGGSGSSQRENLPSLSPTVASLVTGAVTGSAGSTAAGDVYITVQGSVLSEQDLVDAVQNGLNYNALAGKRSDIGRIAGMFG